jgi:hypothetical protein
MDTNNFSRKAIGSIVDPFNGSSMTVPETYLKDLVGCGNADYFKTSFSTRLLDKSNCVRSYPYFSSGIKTIQRLKDDGQDLGFDDLEDYLDLNDIFISNAVLTGFKSHISAKMIELLALSSDSISFATLTDSFDYETAATNGLQNYGLSYEGQWSDDGLSWDFHCLEFPFYKYKLLRPYTYAISDRCGNPSGHRHNFEMFAYSENVETCVTQLEFHLGVKLFTIASNEKLAFNENAPNDSIVDLENAFLIAERSQYLVTFGGDSVDNLVDGLNYEFYDSFYDYPIQTGFNY